MKAASEDMWHVLRTIGSNQNAMMAGQARDTILDPEQQTGAKRCGSCEDMVRYVLERVKYYGLEHKYIESVNDADNLKLMENRDQSANVDETRIMVKLEEELTTVTSNLRTQLNSFKSFLEKVNDTKQEIVILENIGTFLGTYHSAQESEQAGFNTGDMKMTWVAGMLNQSKILKFQKAVYRATRGNVMIEYKYIQTDSLSNSGQIDEQFDKKNTFLDPKTGKGIGKVLVFMISLNVVTEPKTGKTMAGEFRKIIERFEMFTLELPKGSQDQAALLHNKRTELQEGLKVLKATTSKVRDILSVQLKVSADTDLSLIEEHKLYIHREQMILQAKTYLQTEDEGNVSLQKFFIWTPERMQEEMKAELKGLKTSVKDLIEPVITQVPAENYNSTLKCSVKIPTSYMVNDLTTPFNEIVETYSIPKYKEINPGIFTVTSFPFLFGVMFGDVGHGMVLLVGAIILCCKSNALKKAGMKDLASMRYLLLFMGFFAVFCGAIYNEFFAIPIPWQKSCYTKGTDSKGATVWNFINMKSWTDPITKVEKQIPDYGDCVYMFGMDHVWGMSTNSIIFNNSLKMKLAVVLGILHMCFGICMRGLNAIYFKSAVDFICEFVPQLLFFGGLFGYMVLLIIMKWVTNWTIPCEQGQLQGRVPQVISIFSSIMSDPTAGGKLPVIGYDQNALPDAQSRIQFFIQLVILGVAGVCVFIILIPKPIIVSAQQKAARKAWDEKKGGQLMPENSDDELGEKLITAEKDDNEYDAPHEPEPFGELMIHQ